MTLLLLPYPDIKPEIFSIGPFAIRWYALAYIAGLVIGWQIMRRVCRQPPRVLSPEKIDDFLLWAALGVILGGRLGYVLFYKPGFFLQNPLQHVTLWRPGLLTVGFCIGYAISRIAGEIFREPASFMGFLLGSNWLTMGMILSLPVLAFGAWLVARAYRTAPLPAS